MELNIIVGLTFTILGFGLSYLSFRRNDRKDIKEETKEDVSKKIELDTKLNLMLNSNAEIKNDVRSLDSKFDKFKDDFSERLTRCEESSKQAHKRIDTLEQIKK